MIDGGEEVPSALGEVLAEKLIWSSKDNDLRRIPICEKVLR